jgi:hypothetical protein
MKLSTPLCVFDTVDWAVVRLSYSRRGSRLQLKGPQLPASTGDERQDRSRDEPQRSNNVRATFCHKTVALERLFLPQPRYSYPQFCSSTDSQPGIRGWARKHGGGCRKGISVCAGLPWTFMPTGIRQGRKAVLKHFRSIFRPLMPGSVVGESRGEGGSWRFTRRPTPSQLSRRCS